MKIGGRASVMFPKGSADYWEYRDKQEQQYFEDDEAEEESSDKEKRSRQKDTTDLPLPPRPPVKSRKVDDAKWATEEMKLVEQHSNQLTIKDQLIDETMQEAKTAKQKISRLETQLAESSREHSLLVAEKERELKALDKQLLEMEDKINEEKRRRVCLEESITSLNSEIIAEKDEKISSQQQLQSLREDMKVLQEKVASHNDSLEAKDELVARLKATNSKLEVDFEKSEESRIANMRTIRELEAAADALRDEQKKPQPVPEEVLETLKQQHQSQILILEKKYSTELSAERATRNSLQDTIKRLESQIENAPRDDEVLRTKVKEMRTEISKIRQKKREIQTQFDRNEVELRRLTRKNESLVKQASEGEEAIRKVSDMQKRIDQLEIQQECSKVYEPADDVDDKLRLAIKEMERAQESEAEMQTKLTERASEIDSLKGEKLAKETENDTICVERDQLKKQVEELSSRLDTLRSHIEQQTAEDIEKSKSAEATTEASEEVTQMKTAVQELTSKLKEEVKETDKLFVELFGYKVAKNKHGFIKVAPVNAAGRAQWKKELCVQVSEGEYIPSPSPLLTLYKKDHDVTDDSKLRPCQVIAHVSKSVIRK
eukprot:TRINITY_DN2492_c1_g1_i1.p1 TRINITY_DN2492_c1_g1~~TRINITY_DN2492_c1_g1_i1.p1  ORF type:complete len:628 (+),score=193.27 TRINITY_DN2492_c1_g1_i1:78-1886(+)